MQLLATMAPAPAPAPAPVLLLLLLELALLLLLLPQLEPLPLLLVPPAIVSIAARASSPARRLILLQKAFTDPLNNVLKILYMGDRSI